MSKNQLFSVASIVIALSCAASSWAVPMYGTLNVTLNTTIVPQKNVTFTATFKSDATFNNGVVEGILTIKKSTDKAWTSAIYQKRTARSGFSITKGQSRSDTFTLLVPSLPPGTYDVNVGAMYYRKGMYGDEWIFVRTENGTFHKITVK